MAIHRIHFHVCCFFNGGNENLKRIFYRNLLSVNFGEILYICDIESVEFCSLSRLCNICHFRFISKSLKSSQLKFIIYLVGKHIKPTSECEIWNAKWVVSFRIIIIFSICNIETLCISSLDDKQFWLQAKCDKL